MDNDDSQTHQAWYVQQEVADLMHVMLGPPDIAALIPADTYAARLELSKKVIYMETEHHDRVDPNPSSAS